MSLSARKQDLTYLTSTHLPFLNVGIHLDSLKGRDFFRNMWKFLFFLSCIGYFQVAMINFVIQNISKVDVVSRNLSVSNHAFLVGIKITLFLVKGDKFLKLISDMNLLAKKANLQERQKWLAENRLARVIGQMYLCVCWMGVIFAGLVPILLMTYIYFKSNCFKRIMLFDARFPLDNGELSLFIPNYICCLLYMYALMNMTVAIDSLYGWYIYNISAHFRILRCKIEKISSNLENGKDINHFTHDVTEFVRYHMKTLDFVDVLNDIFGSILFFEVTMSCLQMCFVICTLNTVDVIYLPFNIILLVVIPMQLVIYCCGGQKIQDESSMLCSDMYLCLPWQKMTPKQREHLHLPLMRSQKLSVLSGLFFEANNNLFVYIMKTAYSFNALLVARKG